GELITITGVGFDSSFVEANQVSIAGLPLEISQVSDRQIIALLPDGAVSGRVAVSNGRGTALSSREFAVVPSVHIAGTGHTTVRPLETIKLTAVVTGLVDTAVDWHVDDIPGGSEVLGTIDAFGNYTAPAVPPAAASVRISATSAANQSLRAAQVIALSAPLPLVAGDTVNALTGGRIHGRNGLLTIDVPPAALANDAKVTALHAEHPAWGADADIEGVPDGYVPVAAFEVRLAHEEELREPIGFSLLLPVQTPPQTEHVILLHDGRVYERTGEARVDVSADGFSLTGSLGAVNFRALVVRTAASFEIPGLVPTLEIVPPVEVTGIEVPVTIIEEGMTLPVLVEGAGFVPGATRVSAAEPAVGQHLEFGPVVVSADGAELGFTLRIKPIRTLDRGQTLPVSFRVEILNPSGQTSWVLETDANQFQINGLPELVVCEGERGNRSDLFTIDGQRIDRAVSQSQRLSTLVVCEGFVLGIGREVEDIEADGIVWDLSGLAGFEDAFGRLAWVTEQQRRSHSVSIFQPEHRLVFFDVTGPVEIRGTIYFSGMRGGENAQVVRARGGGRGLHGGLASGTLSGGRGGDGGITSGGATTDGQRAGNNVTPDLGIGRGADGRLSGNQPAGFGSRFDPINVSFDDFFKAGAEVFASAFSPKASFITVAKAAGNFAAEMVHLSSTTTIRLAPQPLIVSGQGGHPGSRPTAAPELIDDRRLVPGTGGGGGASAYTETVLFGLITLRTDHRTGGAGAGGGGAAGALRITSGTSLEIGPNGSLLGIGGRGGFGESHISLASTGGGGGGGAGGVAKLQAPQLANRGLIDLSGGERAGAILAQSSFPAPFI
ncbi:IPT/TIG domain-containing protein, partial [Aquisalimonas sp.]|uniref:IPT/TIG domain-containing protein n=1 Tax=Aquisalimonas sp. TaxID=1872621 RepID=UPI0025BCF9B4